MRPLMMRPVYSLMRLRARNTTLRSRRERRAIVRREATAVSKRSLLEAVASTEGLGVGTPDDTTACLILFRRLLPNEKHFTITGQC